MEIRPRFASGFYPRDRRPCERQIDEFVDQVDLPDDLGDRPLGGIVPHAGWVYSGLTAAWLWTALARAAEPPEVVVLLGAVHVRGVARATVYSGDAWKSPLGDLPVDRRLADAFAGAGDGDLGSGLHEHDGEHSLEVQVPFIQRLLPDVPIVPVAVPADRRALRLGPLLGRIAAADGRRVAVVASTDLTHYGERYGFAPMGTGDAALRWSEGNDQRLIDRVLAFDGAGVLDEAKTQHNACGAGAVAACVGAAGALGSDRATLLHKTTSYEVRPVGPPDLCVGYAAVLFA